MPDPLELDAYFERIGLAAAPSPDLTTLRALHRLHPAAIPFENLSTLVGDPVPLDLVSLQRKLVTERRGGYCFEQNRLFAAMLAEIGFEVTALAARVVWNRAEGPLGPRSHMVLLVVLDGDRYLCDVGFGGLTLTGPLRFETGLEQSTPHETFRLAHAGSEYVLEANIRGEWRPLYRFDLQAQLPVDLDVLNHFVATHASSPFRSILMAARRTPQGGYALRNNELSIYADGAKEQAVLETTEDLERALTELFGIRVPQTPALRAALDKLIA
jgi:N-hydroxyarylamine O-acetyltransferase